MRRLSRQATDVSEQLTAQAPVEVESNMEQAVEAVKEDIQMEQNQVVEAVVEAKVEAVEMAPAIEHAAEITLSKRDNRVYVTENGVEMSRKEWVLNKFAADWKRGQIAKALGVPVQVIFGYTRDLSNAFHKPNVGAGRTAGTAVNPLTGESATRTEVIKQLSAAGHSRGEIVKMLGVSYQVVYNATKELKAAEVVEPATAQEPQELGSN